MLLSLSKNWNQKLWDCFPKVFFPFWIGQSVSVSASLWSRLTQQLHMDHHYIFWTGPKRRNPDDFSEHPVDPGVDWNFSKANTWTEFGFHQNLLKKKPLIPCLYISHHQSKIRSCFFMTDLKSWYNPHQPQLHFVYFVQFELIKNMLAR